MNEGLAAGAPARAAGRAAEPALCVGAAHWDLIGRADAALPPGADGPGQVVRRPGGVALNVALALAALGAPARLLAVVGRDPEGERLLAAATSAGVDCGAVLRGAGPTDAYLAVEAGGALIAAVADCRALDAGAPALLAALRAARWRGPAVVDGNLPAEALAALAAERLLDPGTLTFVPASPVKAARLAGPLAASGAAIACNRAEAEAICGARFAAAAPAARALVALGARRALVSDGAAAAALACPGGAVAEARPAALAPAGVTGAGDALAAALVAAEAAGALDPPTLLAAALDAAAAHLRAAP